MKDRPAYTHDCDRCIFLGQWSGEDPHFPSRGEMVFDLYMCPTALQSYKHLITRHSSQPADYGSYDWKVGTDLPAFKEGAMVQAWKRAQLHLKGEQP